MGSFAGWMSGKVVALTMQVWNAMPALNTGTSPADDSGPDTDSEQVTVPELRPMVVAQTETAVEPQTMEVELPPSKKKKKKKAKKAATQVTPEVKGVVPVGIAPMAQAPVVEAVVAAPVKPPPVVKLHEAKLGTKLKEMIKPSVGEEGSRILFYLDHVFTPGEVPIYLGKHLVTYKIQGADGTVSPEQHCTTLKILFDTPKLMKKMDFQKISFGYILKKTQMHGGKSYAVHITVPRNPQKAPTSLDNWKESLNDIYAGIFPAGGPTPFSGLHVTFEVDTGMNNSGYYPRDGWKTARGMDEHDDKLQSVVCRKAADAYLPLLKPLLQKALGEIEQEFEAAVTAGRASYLARNPFRG